jgi:aryl-alcohol dehydrogenase-like predicted oxidoreductase
MKSRKVGTLDVSVVGVGCNNFGTDFFGPGCDQKTVTRIVNTALDAGITLFDTAEEYSITSYLGEGHSEELLGTALRGRRDEAVVATKFLNTSEHSPGEIGADRIVAALEASLQRLGTDRIDLYQQHFPDPRQPMDETLEALDRLVRAGKVREIGCCNVSAAGVDDAAKVASDHGTGSFRSCQLQFSVLERPGTDVIAALARHDIGLLAYFPLASGLLTGKYRRDTAPPPGSRLGADAMVSQFLRDGIMATRPPLSAERLTTVEQLGDFARDRGHTLLELAISWVACQPTVASVLTGVTSADQMAANATAAEWRLSAADLVAIDAIVKQEASDEGA